MEYALSNPLKWPIGQPETKQSDVKHSKFIVPSAQKAWLELVDECWRFEADLVTLTCNANLTKNRITHETTFGTPGAALYITKSGQNLVFACDQYWMLRDNIRAIQKTIDAVRGIERWGGKQVMNVAMQGFTALPASTNQQKDLDLLGITTQNPTEEEVRKAFLNLAKTMHPDRGGSTEAYLELVEAARRLGVKA